MMLEAGEAHLRQQGEDLEGDNVYEESRSRMFDIHRIPLEAAKSAVRSVAIPGGLRNEKAMVGEKAVPPPEHPPGLFPLHTLVGFVGSCGRGKTNAVYILAKAYLDHGSFNRVYLITPTYESNMLWKKMPKLDRQDVYEDVAGAQAAIADIVSKITETAKTFKIHSLYKKAYEKWKKRETLEPEEQTLLANMANEDGVPQEPFDMEQPSPLIIIDDMSSSPLFRASAANPFINLVLRHRHIAEVGVSIFVCVQNFRAGIPKVLRENFRVFCIFDTKDAKALEAIYDEVGSLSDAQSFLLKYRTAIDDNEHNFLTVDRFPDAPDPETARLRQFRQNFDRYLIDPRTRDSVLSKVEQQSSRGEEQEGPQSDPLRRRRNERRGRVSAATAGYLSRAQDPYSAIQIRF